MLRDNKDPLIAIGIPDNLDLDQIYQKNEAKILGSFWPILGFMGS